MNQATRLANAIAPLAPDVCDIVIYGKDSFGKKPQKWRVDSWLKERPPVKRPDITKPGASFSDVIENILYEAQQEVSGKKMMWCHRHEATHVSLTAVCGAIAPISECEVVGRVSWSAEQIAEARASAVRMADEKEAVF